ncbi:LamG-like jellyroll fold domain-containing protein [Gelidibacter salicanalis]|uniref:T9SS type A sorting domain-containing protein n=1 Tax=Gelidibacter salicanalis TaxID=291193 RepID=A0A934NH67_9FLAO|nr:LamG-like jellyroll fold domain-containing protein [Gelidibacter salicanalis]MBJ7879313.1 T9SS type A sorting domain-containing protein [Gelidibacter salicanalis]
MKRYYSQIFRFTLLFLVTQVSLGNSNLYNLNSIISSVPISYNLNFEYHGHFEALNLSGFTASKRVFNERLVNGPREGKLDGIEIELREVITCPIDLSVSVDPGFCGAIVDFPLPTTDISGGAMVLTTALGKGDLFPVGTTEVIYEEREASAVPTGKTCIFQVTVVDNIPPQVTTQIVTVNLDATGNATIAKDAVNNGSSDACGGLTFDTNITAFTCSNVGANTVVLTVTDANGQSANSNATVNVQPYTTSATVTYSIAENKTTVCDFDTLNFTAQPNNPGADSASYEWFVNDGVSLGSGLTFSYNSWTAPNDVVKLVMTFGSGSCAPKKEYSSTISVNPVKSVNFNIITPSNICIGENATFTIGSPQNFGTATYEWRLNGGAVISNTATLTTNALTVAGANTIELKVTSTANCVNPTTVIKSVNVTTVNPKPTLTVTNGVVCASNQTSINLNTLVTSDAGATVTFHDTAANADNGSSAIANVVSPSADKTYYVRSRFNTGCYVTSQLNVAVNPLPTIAVGSNPSICNGDTFDLSTIFTGPNLTYYTSLANAKNKTATISKDVSPTTTTSYYVRAEDSGTGCYNTNSVTVTVNPLPSLTINNGAVCASGQTSVDLNTLVTTNGTTTFYSSEANATDATSAMAPSVSPTTQMSYWVRTQLGTGCFKVGEIVISVNALPTLTVADGSVCASSQTSINLNSLVTNTNGNTVTFHSTQSNADDGTSAINASVSPASETRYYVRSKLTNGCYSTASILISVDSLPTFDVMPTEICNGDSIDLSTTVSNNTGNGLTFFSSLANANSGTNAIAATVNPTNSSTYYIRSANTAGCYTVNPVVITVSDTVSIALDSGNKNPNICAGSTIPAMTFKITNGGTAAGATVTASPGTGITLSGSYNAATKIYTVTGTTTSAATIGTYNFTVTPTGCGAGSAAVQAGTIRIFNGVPAIPTNLDILSSSFIICPTSTETYEVTADPNVQTYNWTFPSGFSITSGADSHKVTVNVASNASAGIVSVTAINSCGPSDAAFQAIKIGSVAANAGPDQYICAINRDSNTRIRLAGSVTVADVKNYGQDKKGEWWWSDNGAGGEFIKFSSGNSGDWLDAWYKLPPNLAFTEITITIQTIKPSGTNNCGQGAKDDMKIYVRDTPTASVASNGAICTGSTGSVIFSGTPNTTITFKVGTNPNQTIALGAGNGTTATANFTTAALTMTTDVIIQSVAYINNSPCINTFTTKPTATIVVNPLNTVTPGLAITVCQSTSPTPIPLSGASVGTGAQGEWIIISGGGSLSSSGMTSTPAAVTYTPAVNYKGDVVLRLSTNAPGKCPSVNANRTIIINEAPTVVAGTQGNICQSDIPTAVTLNGASVGGGNGNATAAWSITNGGGSLSSTAQTNTPSTVTYTPQANYTGQVTLTLTTNAPGACATISDTRVFNIDELPTLVTGTYGPVCQSASPTAITLSGASVGGPSGATAQWSIVSGGGSLSPASGFSANPENVTYLPATNYNGEVVLKLTSSSNGTCIPVEKTTNILVNKAATIDAGPATAIICEGENVTLNGSFGGSATSGTWTSSSNNNGGFGNTTAASTTYTPSANDVQNGTVTLTFSSNDPDGTGPCLDVSDAIVVTINEAVNLVVTGDTDICSDESSTIVADLSNGSATSGTWTSSSNNNGGFANASATSTTYTPSTSDINNGTVTLTFTTNDPDAAGPCGAVSETIIIAISKKPFINENTENLGVCATQPAALSVVASGDDLTYQWYKGNPGSGVAVLNSPPQIAGATSNTLNFTNTSTAHAGNYYVIVSGNSTCDPVTSEVAVLIVNKDIDITTQPIEVTDCVGNTVTFTVEATGSIGSHQWKKDGANFSGGTPTFTTAGTLNTFTLEIQNIAAGDAGDYALQILSDGGTCSEANTTIASLTVTQIPTATISYTSPLCSNDTTLKSVTLTGTHAYTIGTFAAVATSGGPNLDLKTNGDIDPSNSDPGTYTVTYTIPASGGCPADDSATTVVTINPLPVITAFSYTDSGYCESDVATYTPTITVSNGFGGTYSASSGLSIDSTTGKFSPNGVAPDTYTITYTAINPDGCSTVVNESFEIIIEAKPDANFTYSESVFCNNGTDPIAIISGDSGGTFTSTPDGVVFTNAATGEIDVSASVAGTYDLLYTFTAVAGGCGEVQESFKITINALPVITTFDTSVAQYCETDTTDYTRTIVVDNDLSGSLAVTPNSNLDVSLMNNVITISPNSSDVGVYQVTYTANIPAGCATTVVSETFNVTIGALPVAVFNYEMSEYCKTGVNPILSYASGGVAGTYTYTSSPANLALGLNATTGAIDLATSAAGTYTITNTIPASGGCIDVVHTETVTIYEASNGGVINIQGTTDRTKLVCYDSNSNPPLILSGYTGTIVKWQYSTNSGAVWIDIANTTDSQGYDNVNATRIYRAIIKSGNCSETPSSIAVISVIPNDIKPNPVSVSEETICLGETVTFNATSGYATGSLIEEGGAFENSNPKGWKADGCDNCLNAGSSSTKTDGFRLSASNGGTYSGINYLATGKFAITSGNVSGYSNERSVLETPIFNLLGLNTAKLRFNHAYNLLAGATAKVEISMNGGINYTTVLATFTGPSTLSPYNAFPNMEIDLSPYIGQTNLRLRFNYSSSNASSWAIDNIRIPDRPINENIVWTNEAGVEVSNQASYVQTPKFPGVHTYTVTSYLNGCNYAITDQNSVDISVNVNYAYAGQNFTPASGKCGESTVALNAYDNTLTAADNIANGAYVNTDSTLNFAKPGTGVGGIWSVSPNTAICGITPIFSKNDDPRATFTGPAGTYILTWTVDKCSSNITVVLEDCNKVDFDGTDDYITFGDAFNRGANFSFEAWVKPNSIVGNQTILSKRNVNNNATGYDLSLNGAALSFNCNGSESITSPYLLTTSRWYHVAVAFGGGNYELYIDGILVKTTTGVAPITNNSKFLLGAMDQAGSPPNKPMNYFNGWIDEVRLWNKKITQVQLRQMMNQKIKIDGTAVAGEVIPFPISGLNWTDLDGYYRMNFDCAGLISLAGTVAGRLRNMTTNQPNTAPLPYTSRVSGQTWDADNTWTNFDVWDTPNSVGIDNSTRIDWNIVSTDHDIISNTRDLTLLGLLVNSNKLTIKGAGSDNETNDGNGLRVTHYLKLDGTIDLVGESQLVQDEGGLLDAASTGKLKRDQQGTGNLFNYNYWGSPVVAQGSSAGNYTLSGVLRDGTNSSAPVPITWISGHNGAPGPPINLSTRWLTTYTNKKSNTYASWERINENTAINIGLGYTMKGSGASTATQNYVFVGKPNNGTITNPISPGNDALVGNPYPSAIDAKAFIMDNASSLIDGSIQFWDHFGVNNTHILREYQGGYATYNLSGGLTAVTPLITSDGVVIEGGAGSKQPGQFIPVGQGFFVTANTTTGGTLIFKNSQRVFNREGSGSSLFLRGADGNTSAANYRTNNPQKDSIKRIRLEFKSPEGTVRPLLLGFVPNYLATDGVDYGYDAVNRDAISSDLSWSINESKYIIQGVGDFEETKKFPFAMQLSKDGAIEIKLTELENFSEAIDVYIYDSVLGTYHQINTTSFAISLDAGNYDKRFFLVFKDDKTLSIIDEDFKNVVVKFLQNTDEIFIQTPSGINVKQVYLVNIIGQTVQAWNATNITLSNEMKIPVKNLPEGSYVIKIQTDTGTYNKKIVLKY